MSKKATDQKSLVPLQAAIGYKFQDLELLTRALTHCSVGPQNNERFEFLGDSLINLVMAEALYQKFPRASEGELTRLRAMCVKGDTLAEIADVFKLGDYLKLGIGELKSGGAKRPSILADALEATIAAIYLDANFEAMRQCVLKWYEARLDTMTLSMTQKDPKTQLQEWLQGRKLALPVYTVVEIEGDSHQQAFRVQCDIASPVFSAEGRGESRRKAEQEAAEKVLEFLKHDK
ncbi:MAG: ribonuclease III [Gammaproteobacteria bacterium]